MRKLKLANKRRINSETKPEAFAENGKHFPKVSRRCDFSVMQELLRHLPRLKSLEPAPGLTRPVSSFLFLGPVGLFLVSWFVGLLALGPWSVGLSVWRSMAHGLLERDMNHETWNEHET